LSFPAFPPEQVLTVMTAKGIFIKPRPVAGVFFLGRDHNAPMPFWIKAFHIVFVASWFFPLVLFRACSQPRHRAR